MTERSTGPHLPVDAALAGTPGPVSGAHVNEASAGLHISLEPGRVTLVLAAMAAGLVLAHVALQLARFGLGLDVANPQVVNLLEELHLSMEANIPTYFSSLMLLLAALLLAVIAAAASRRRALYRWHWTGLAAVFAYLAVDEMLAWHEFLIAPVRAALNTSGLLYFAWVIPYGLLVLVLAGAYLRFFLGLPRRTRSLIVVAALCFLAGAVGVEMLGGRHADFGGLDNVALFQDGLMVTYQTLEEVLEMSGVLVFIYALLSYIASHLSPLWLGIGGYGNGRTS